MRRASVTITHPCTNRALRCVTLTSRRNHHNKTSHNHHNQPKYANSINFLVILLVHIHSFSLQVRRRSSVPWTSWISRSFRCNRINWIIGSNGIIRSSGIHWPSGNPWKSWSHWSDRLHWLHWRYRSLRGHGCHWSKRRDRIPRWRRQSRLSRIPGRDWCMGTRWKPRTPWSITRS